MKNDIKNSLKELGFSFNEIKVYIASTELGEASASQIAKKCNIPRTTAISILNKLEEQGYLTTHKYRGKAYYWIESPKVLVNSFERKKEIAESLSDQLSDLYHSVANFPHANVYDTKIGIRNFMAKTLSTYDKKTIIHTIDNPGGGNYNKIFSESINNSLVKYKQKRNIITHTLIPYGSFKSIENKKISDHNIEIREMPKEINFDSSFWVLKDKIVHFSGNPPFLVVIDHKIIFHSMKSLFDFLWSISKTKK